MHAAASPDRRRVLRAALGLGLAPIAAVGRGWAATPRLSDPFAEGATLLVAGPEGGSLQRWGGLIAAAVAPLLPGGAAVRTDRTGGSDGVTGANQFEARAAPDGQTLLLVPGEAALAWLAGDPRAQFDVAHWLPVMAATTPALLVGRTAPPAFRPGSALRIGAAGPAGPDLAALLALDLLRVETVPMFGLNDADALLGAFKQQAIDVVFAHGPAMRTMLTALADLGGRPLFAFGTPAEGRMMARDPMFPDVPTLAELSAAGLGTEPSGPLYQAWRAAAAAVQLQFALVLPQLTPAATVAVWRRACAQAALAPDLADAAEAEALRLHAGSAAGNTAAALSVQAASLLEVRHWLTSAFNWRPT